MNVNEMLMARAIVNEYLLEVALFSLLRAAGDHPRVLTSMRSNIVDAIQFRMHVDGPAIGDPLVTQKLAVQYAGQVFDRLAARLVAGSQKP